jgi:hypothetical protein
LADVLDGFIKNRKNNNFKVGVLATLGDVFDGFIGDFAANIAGWQQVFDSDDPLDVEWPNNFKAKCNPKIIIGDKSRNY